MRGQEEVLSGAAGWRPFLWISCLLGAGILAALAKWPPFWALMDDAGNLEYVRSSAAVFLPWVKDRLQSEFTTWGLFRPVYWVFVYVFYGFFGTVLNSPGLAYWVNSALVLLLFYVWGVVFERTLISDSHDLHFRDWRWLFFSLCCLFTPHYNLLFFASLCEKFILWGGAAMLWAVHRFSRRPGSSVGPSLLLLIGGFCFAWMSKATSLFLAVPAGVWLLVLMFRRRDARVAALFLSLIVAALSGAVFSMTHRGPYTAGYQLDDLWGKLLSSGPRFLGPLFVGLFSLVVLAVHGIKRRQPIEVMAERLVWPLGLIGFLGIMLPWPSGVSAYYVTPGGVFLVGSALAVLRVFLEAFSIRRRLAAVAVVVAVVASAPLAASKFRVQVTQRHGVRHVLSFLRQESDAHGERLIAAMPEPCLESSVALSTFLGRQDLVRLAAGNHFPKAAGSGARRLMVVNRDCSAVLSSFTPGAVVFRYEPWIIYEESK